MADLVLTEDHRQYQDLARDFSRNEIAPLAHDYDHMGTFPAELYERAWGIGLFNTRVPEDLGGLGLGVWDACVMAEEVGAGCAGIAAGVWANDTAVSLVMTGGSAEQKSLFVEPLTANFGLAALCFNDDMGSSQAITFKRVAEAYVLNGRAATINAGYASWIAVVARDADTPDSLAVFAMQTGVEGFHRGNSMPRVGMKAADLRFSEFNNVTLTKVNVIASSEDAERVLQLSQAEVAPVIAAYTIGLMRSALENSITYSKQRHTMGKPIAQHQAVGFMISDLAKDTDAARLMAWKAASLCDGGHSNTNLSEMARAFACDAAMRGTTDAVQIYGGYGYSREYPVEKLMRDAKTFQLLVGRSSTERVNLGRQLVAGASAGSW